MNILLSLLIYNPIEMYCLLLLCDIITGIKTKFGLRIVPRLYVFGTINIVIQIFPVIWIHSPYFMVISAFVNYFITPFSVMLFYRTIGNDISYRRCFVASAINCLFAIIIPGVLALFIKNYNMFYIENKLHEFITNVIIFSVQILLYSIIRIKGEKYYEKLCKNRS